MYGKNMDGHNNKVRNTANIDIPKFVCKFHNELIEMPQTP